MGTNFYKLLFDISEALVTDDLAAMKFLSMEHIPVRKLEAIQEPKAFLRELQEKGMIQEGNLSFLKELLYRISRIDLLETLLGSSGQEVERELQIPGRAKVSAYRQLLYGIAEDLSPEDVKCVKFLLRKRIPNSKLQDNASMLKVLLEMERKALIKEDDLSMLKDILKGFRADITKKVVTFEEQKKENDCKEKLLYPAPVSVHPARQTAESETRHLETSIKSVGSNIKDNKEACLTQGFSEIKLVLRGGLSNAENESKKVKSYKMDGPHRGFCLVINNVKFNQSLSERRGSFKDAEELERVFTWLGLDVRIYTDLTSQNIKELMQTWQQLQDHKDRDCFICCILSHGESGAVYGKDEELVSIRTIMSYFTARQCPQLAEKPKLFFIQACQGKEIQCGVPVKTDARIPDSSSMQQSFSPSESIPEEADFLLGMATIDGYVSFRHIQQGAWYIQALCSKLQLLVPRGEDILSILTEVNEDVARRVDRLGTKKQMPLPAYTLTRKLIFPIPRDPPPSQQCGGF
ncbi:caspase-8-like [Neopsephotus bourkii]|uniref:caspase-8-like n=1 Tax=Neopsephotus bourkii TaxID=309878 RepID=UPI002AA5A97B|nr:caspase-8-like [Neopsephotus bourkii]